MDVSKIELSMLPEEYQQAAELIGIETFMKLCHYYGGTNLYIPKKDRVTRHIRDAKIQAEFDGANYKDISSKYKLSESYIRKIVGNPSQQVDQTTIFDFID